MTGTAHQPIARDAARAPRPRRGAFTLVELVVSMAVFSILAGAMVSAIVIAARSIPDGQSPVEQHLAAMRALDEITEDLFYATSITSTGVGTSGVSSIVLTVDDRGHGLPGPETIRYAWSGVPGDPVTRQYNGGAVTNVLDHAYDFALALSLKTGPTPSTIDVLFVTSDAASPPAEDVARMAKMQSWGYTVQPIDDSDSAAMFSTAIATSDVIYISEQVGGPTPGLKPIDGYVGVVTDEAFMTAMLGISSLYSVTSGDTIDIIDNTHDITSGLALGSLVMCTSNQPLTITAMNLAPGAQVLAEINGKPSLVVLDLGAMRSDGGVATSRRVKLAWGGDSFTHFSFASLNAGSLQRMRRAIAWAAAPVLYSGATIRLQPSADPAGAIETQTPIVNTPRAAGS